MSYRSALYRTTSSLRLGNRVRRLTVSQPPRISSKLHFDTQYGSLALAASILAGACLYQNYETTKTAPLMVAPHLGSFAASVLEPEDRFQPIATTFTKPLEQPYDISIRAIKGGRVTMEDEYFVAQGGRFAAVFDGHGGNGVSRFLKYNLYDCVQRHLSSNDHDDKGAASVFKYVAALKGAFREMDHQVLDNDTLAYQGSTAVAVVLHENEKGNRTLLSANIGDSRAVLSRQGSAVDLTRDHKPNDEREKTRIMSMGETIEWDRFAKVHRVRNLSLSRAVGDRYAKPVVSGEVEIQHYPIQDNDEFVLLASDGLWDVMSSDDAVKFVHKRMENELSRENIFKEDVASYKLVLRRNMAKLLAREAVKRGSGDNVCVILVWLNDIHKQS